jgi:hypothetical protein
LSSAGKIRQQQRALIQSKNCIEDPSVLQTAKLRAFPAAIQTLPRINACLPRMKTATQNLEQLLNVHLSPASQ